MPEDATPPEALAGEAVTEGAAPPSGPVPYRPLPEHLFESIPDPRHRRNGLPADYEPPAMLEPDRAPWGVGISGDDFSRLRMGFEPHDQNDKWLIAAAGPDGETSLTTVSIVRWLSKQTFYAFHVRPGGGGDGDDKKGRFVVESFTWDRQTNISDTVEEAREIAVVLCRCHLRCAFEELPFYEPRW